MSASMHVLPAVVASPAPSTRELAIRGALWTFAGYGLAQVLRLASNLILTRMLAPEMFGLMALVNVFLIGLNLFSDIGLGPSIVQNRRGEETRFLNTAWTMQVLRGGVLWLCCLLITVPVARLYDNEQLLWLLPVVGLTTVLSGFYSTALFTLNRRIDIRRLTGFEFGSQLIALLAAVAWAWFSPTIWALVVGNLVAGAVRVVWSHRLLPEQRNRLDWERSAVAELFTFGKWIFLATAVSFLASQSDRLILGKLLSFELLGIYSIAFFLAEVPRQMLQKLTGNILFPLLSRQAELPRAQLRAAVLRKRRLLLPPVALLLALLVGFGDALILLLYDERYQQAAWMLPLLALGIWPVALTQTSDPALLAIGKPLYAAIGCIAKFIALSAGLLLGYRLLGLPGAVLAVACSELPFYAVISHALCRERLSVLSQDAWATGLMLGFLVLVLVARQPWLPGLPLEHLP